VKSVFSAKKRLKCGVFSSIDPQPEGCTFQDWPFFNVCPQAYFITQKNNSLKIPHSRHILAKGAICPAKVRKLPQNTGYSSRTDSM